MNRRVFILLALAAALFLAGAGCSLLGGGQSQPAVPAADVNKIQKPAETLPAAADTGAAAAQPQTTEPPMPAANQETNQQANIIIQDFAFSPASLTIKEGVAVTWSNDDSAPHQITADAGSDSGLQSGILYTGQSFNFTFTKKGTFGYHCQIHPGMTGTIIVE